VDLDENVVIDLVEQLQNAGRAAGDTFESVERIVGTEHGDVFRGDGEDNRFYGGGGQDAFFGRGGTDYFYGGEGKSDIASFSGAMSEYRFRAVYVDGERALEVQHIVPEARDQPPMGDGVDYLIGVELMSFGRQTVAVSDFL
jgi:Ca2+-binding RTX toxin-like protein